MADKIISVPDDCDGSCSVDNCLKKDCINDEFAVLHVVVNIAMCTKGVLRDLEFVQRYTDYSSTDAVLRQVIEQLRNAAMLRRLLHDDAAK